MDEDSDEVLLRLSNQSITQNKSNAKLNLTSTNQVLDLESESDDCCTSVSRCPVNPLSVLGPSTSSKLSLPIVKMVTDDRFWQEQDRNGVNDIKTEDVTELSSSVGTFSGESKKKNPVIFSEWCPILNNKELQIGGYTINGDVDTRTIDRRISGYIFYDNLEVPCSLGGPMTPLDFHPKFIRRKFNMGIPEDWVHVRSIWIEFEKRGSPENFAWLSSTDLDTETSDIDVTQHTGYNQSVRTGRKPAISTPRNNTNDFYNMTNEISKIDAADGCRNHTMNSVAGRIVKKTYTSAELKRKMSKIRSMLKVTLMREHRSMTSFEGIPELQENELELGADNREVRVDNVCVSQQTTSANDNTNEHLLQNILQQHLVMKNRSKNNTNMPTTSQSKMIELPRSENALGINHIHADNLKTPSNDNKNKHLLQNILQQHSVMKNQSKNNTNMPTTSQSKIIELPRSENALGINNIHADNLKTPSNDNKNKHLLQNILQQHSVMKNQSKNNTNMPTTSQSKLIELPRSENALGINNIHVDNLKTSSNVFLNKSQFVTKNKSIDSIKNLSSSSKNSTITKLHVVDKNKIINENLSQNIRENNSSSIVKSSETSEMSKLVLSNQSHSSKSNSSVKNKLKHHSAVSKLSVNNTSKEVTPPTISSEGQYVPTKISANHRDSLSLLLDKNNVKLTPSKSASGSSSVIDDIDAYPTNVNSVVISFHNSSPIAVTSDISTNGQTAKNTEIASSKNDSSINKHLLECSFEDSVSSLNESSDDDSIFLFHSKKSKNKAKQNVLMSDVSESANNQDLIQTMKVIQNSSRQINKVTSDENVVNQSDEDNQNLNQTSESLIENIVLSSSESSDDDSEQNSNQINKTATTNVEIPNAKKSLNQIVEEKINSSNSETSNDDMIEVNKSSIRKNRFLSESSDSEQAEDTHVTITTRAIVHSEEKASVNNDQLPLHTNSKSNNKSGNKVNRKANKHTKKDTVPDMLSITSNPIIESNVSSVNTTVSRRGRTRCSTLPFWMSTRLVTIGDETMITNTSALNSSSKIAEKRFLTPDKHTSAPKRARTKIPQKSPICGDNIISSDNDGKIQTTGRSRTVIDSENLSITSAIRTVHENQIETSDNMSDSSDNHCQSQLNTVKPVTEIQNSELYASPMSTSSKSNPNQIIRSQSVSKNSVENINDKINGPNSTNYNIIDMSMEYSEEENDIHKENLKIQKSSKSNVKADKLIHKMSNKRKSARRLEFATSDIDSPKKGITDKKEMENSKQTENDNLHRIGNLEKLITNLTVKFNVTTTDIDSPEKGIIDKKEMENPKQTENDGLGRLRNLEKQIAVLTAMFDTPASDMDSPEKGIIDKQSDKHTDKIQILNNLEPKIILENMQISENDKYSPKKTVSLNKFGENSTKTLNESTNISFVQENGKHYVSPSKFCKSKDIYPNSPLQHGRNNVEASTNIQILDYLNLTPIISQKIKFNKKLESSLEVSQETVDGAERNNKDEQIECGSKSTDKYNTQIKEKTTVQMAATNTEKEVRKKNIQTNNLENDIDEDQSTTSKKRNVKTKTDKQKTQKGNIENTILNKNHSVDTSSSNITKPARKNGRQRKTGKREEMKKKQIDTQDLQVSNTNSFMKSFNDTTSSLSSLNTTISSRGRTRIPTLPFWKGSRVVSVNNELEIIGNTSVLNNSINMSSVKPKTKIPTTSKSAKLNTTENLTKPSDTHEFIVPKLPVRRSRKTAAPNRKNNRNSLERKPELSIISVSSDIDSVATQSTNQKRSPKQKSKENEYSDSLVERSKKSGKSPKNATHNKKVTTSATDSISSRLRRRRNPKNVFSEIVDSSGKSNSPKQLRQKTRNVAKRYEEYVNNKCIVEVTPLSTEEIKKYTDKKSTEPQVQSTMNDKQCKPVNQQTVMNNNEPRTTKKSVSSASNVKPAPSTTKKPKKRKTLMDLYFGDPVKMPLLIKLKRKKIPKEEQLINTTNVSTNTSTSIYVNPKTGKRRFFNDEEWVNSKECRQTLGPIDDIPRRGLNFCIEVEQNTVQNSLDDDVISEVSAFARSS